MDEATQHEREVRAARNQSLFREINERLRALNEDFQRVTETFVIACECADRNCVEMLTIVPEDYEEIRAEPRHFAVLPKHVYADVESVVAEHDGYVVVEKQAAAGAVAQQIAAERAE